MSALCPRGTPRRAPIAICTQRLLRLVRGRDRRMVNLQWSGLRTGRAAPYAECQAQGDRIDSEGVVVHGHRASLTLSAVARKVTCLAIVASHRILWILTACGHYTDRAAMGPIERAAIEDDSGPGRACVPAARSQYRSLTNRRRAIEAVSLYAPLVDPLQPMPSQYTT